MHHVPPPFSLYAYNYTRSRRVPSLKVSRAKVSILLSLPPIADMPTPSGPNPRLHKALESTSRSQAACQYSKLYDEIIIFPTFLRHTMVQ